MSGLVFLIYPALFRCIACMTNQRLSGLRISVHLATRFKRRRLFLEITRKKIPMVAMFVNKPGRNEQSLQRTFHICFLPSFGSFGQTDSEEKIFQKSTNQKQELPVAAMLVNVSGQNVQSLQRTFHRCFLQIFDSFGQAVSGEKLFLIDQLKSRIVCGGHVC